MMREADNLSLPQHKHLPGINARLEDGFLHAIALQAHEQTSHESADKNLPWMYGIRLINEGYFWEAHEVLEPVWMNALPNSRIRFLVQCLIHITNARLKLALQQERAAQRLQSLAVDTANRAFTDRGGHLMTLEGSMVLSAAAECGDPSSSSFFHSV